MLGDNETLDRWHPLFMLVQTFIEPGDPINYAVSGLMSPAKALTQKYLYDRGNEDEYTPPEAIYSLAGEKGRVPIIPPIRETIELNEILGINPSGRPPFAGIIVDGEAAADCYKFPM